MRYYCSEEIEEIFEKQTKNKQIEILWNALASMSSNNAQSIVDCVADVMGYDYEYIQDEKMYFKPKKIMEQNNGR